MMAAVISTSSRAGAGLAAAVAASRSGCQAGAVLGEASWGRGEKVQNQMAAMTTAETTLANIRTAALRIVCLSKTDVVAPGH